MSNRTQKRILILEASYSGLDLSEEIRRIENAIESSKKGQLFDTIVRHAVRPEEISRHLRNERPFIVHVCGHGQEDGSLLFKDEGGEDKGVSPRQLAPVFESHASYVKCVLFNTCHSEKLAKEISKYINYTIGMRGEIEDTSAIKFTEGFYKAINDSSLNDQDGFKIAFGDGISAVRMGDFSQASVPVLKINTRVNLSEPINPNQEKNIEANSSEQVTQEILHGLLRPRYSLKEEITKASRATIYRAYDEILERDVAIKVLERKGLEKDFDKSVKKAAKISDEPHFITIHSFDVKNDVHYYVMQFIEGQNLRKWMTNKYHKGLVPVEKVREILLKVGNAIVRARKLNFDGSNIRPSNIMMGKYDEPFISAFNLCESFDAGKTLQELEQMSKELDEQEYQEQLAYLLPDRFTTYCDDDVSNEKSDQYMLGLLAYELLTGKIPTTLDSLQALQQNEYLAFKPLIPITEKRQSCPKKFEKVILKMTSLDPEYRYKTLQEALEAIPNNVNINLHIAKESYERCKVLENFDTDFFRSFYYKFFESIKDLCPHAKSNLFSYKTEEDWKRHHQSLRAAIFSLFAYFELNGQEQHQSEGDETTILSWIAETHRGRNITQKLYEPFVDALIDTVIDFDPLCQENPNYQINIRDAWKKAIEPGVEYMKSKL